ncbi:unnamed protein product [Durusdinium trenchii]|uniref:Major facilitator superfamily (MFS) profile domain-containing protein n=1 Tax=Durusdinium trenchii TaxID=1381693 RepID=A0ABP0RP79_9DINO
MQPIIPLLVAEKFDLSAELWGASCAAEGLAKILCAVPLAVCLKSWGRKPVLVQSFWLLALSILALAHNSSVWGLMGGKFLIGLAVVAQNSAMQLYLTDISSTENKSRVMAPVLMAEKLFSVVGPLVGGKLLESYGVHQAMMKVAAATSMLALINQWMLKETKPTDIGHVPKKTESALKRYKELLQDARIREAVIFSAFYWGIFASVLYCIVPLMLAQVFGYGAWAFSLVLAASNLMCFFCAGPVAQLSDRFGRKAALIPGMLLVGLAPLLLAAVPQLLQNATTSLLKPLILSLSVGSLALGMGLVGGALPTIFTDGVPSRLHVESLSFLRASTELGSVLLTLTMSSMVGSIGFTWPLLGGGLCALYAAARFALKYRFSTYFIDPDEDAASSLGLSVRGVATVEVSPSMLLSPPKITAVYPRMVPWIDRSRRVIDNDEDPSLLVVGLGFVNTNRLRCQLIDTFGHVVAAPYAMYISSTQVRCGLPPFELPGSSNVKLQVSNDGAEWSQEIFEVYIVSALELRQVTLAPSFGVPTGNAVQVTTASSLPRVATLGCLFGLGTESRSEASWNGPFGAQFGALLRGVFQNADVVWGDVETETLGYTPTECV